MPFPEKPRDSSRGAVTLEQVSNFYNGADASTRKARANAVLREWVRRGWVERQHDGTYRRIGGPD